MESIFFHIDVNSAYLSWSALEYLKSGHDTDLREIPSIVGGDMEKRHGIVLAKSIPAKKFGIATGEPIVNAMRKCPFLKTVPPDHNLYAEYSGQLMRFLESICPDIEQVSIDECYMDFTPIAGNYPSCLEAASYIKDSILEKFGYTVNIGISDRKVLCKMASDFKKPNLVHTLFCREIRDKMWPLPVSSLYMCGRSSVEVLKNLGITRIGDLAQSDPGILQAHMKSHGLLLWEYANGIDNSVILPEPAVCKGIGNSITLKKDAVTFEEAAKALLNLSESVGSRLRKAGQAAGMVSVEIKYFDFQSLSHQTTLEAPTNSSSLIYQTACRLFCETWNHSPIRLLGIRTSKLYAAEEPVQMNLFDLMSSSPAGTEKQRRLDTAVDSIRKRFGEDAIVRGSLLHGKDDYKKH